MNYENKKILSIKKIKIFLNLLINIMLKNKKINSYLYDYFQKFIKFKI